MVAGSVRHRRASASTTCDDRTVRRRSLLLGGIGLGGAALLGCKPWVRPVAQPERASPHELATLAAVAETFLPGGDGTPGATEVGAVETLIDPAYGFDAYISELVSDLDEWCLVRHHRLFVDLPAETREVALEERMGLRGKLIKSWYAPAYEAVLALTKLAFFGGLRSRLGTSYLAFPGPSRGYAPASAAGAWAAADLPRPIARGAVSELRVDGPGAVTAARLSVYATSDDDVRAVVRIHAPGGGRHDLPLRAEAGIARIDDVALPIAGGPAEGAWRLEIAEHPGGAGQLELWSLRVRTALDDAGAPA